MRATRRHPHTCRGCWQACRKCHVCSRVRNRDACFGNVLVPLPAVEKTWYIFYWDMKKVATPRLRRTPRSGRGHCGKGCFKDTEKLRV